MPSYWRLKREPAAVRRRTASKLKVLREQMRGEMPFQTTDRSLILGTWNIRNFDDNRFGHGPRLRESLYYIAEVIAAFDVIAIQEVTQKLEPFRELMGILGDEYDFVVTDVTEGRAGNDERLAVIYNRRKVGFTGLAGELVLPDSMLISDVTRKRQFSRTPFMASFQAGWFRFVMATVHIYFGKPSKKSPEYARRVAEIGKVATILARRAREEEENYVLVGDFNIEDFDAKTFDAMERRGFQVFRNREGSNLRKNKFYDQIAFLPKEGELRLSPGGRAHGVLDFFESVFRADDFTTYGSEVRRSLERRIEALEDELEEASTAKKKEKLRASIAELEAVRDDDEASAKYYAGEWRTYQMSDHFPLWVELDIDFTEDYLDTLR